MCLFFERQVFMAEQVSQCLIAPHMGGRLQILERGYLAANKKINQLVIIGERVMFFSFDLLVF